MRPSAPRMSNLERATIREPMEVAAGSIELPAIRTRAEPLHIFIRIQLFVGSIARSAAEREHLHVQTFIEQQLYGTLGRVGPGVVRIEINHHRIGVPM